MVQYRMLPEDFQFRAKAESCIKEFYENNVASIKISVLAEHCKANTERTREVLDGLLEDLIESAKYVARIDKQHVIFHKKRT